MGLKPMELRSTSVYDFNLMAKAFNHNKKHEYNIMRLNAFLVSAYSGLEGKARKKLTPEKMFPLESKRKEIDKGRIFELIKTIEKHRGAEC